MRRRRWSNRAARRSLAAYSDVWGARAQLEVVLTRPRREIEGGEVRRRAGPARAIVLADRARARFLATSARVSPWSWWPEFGACVFLRQGEVSYVRRRGRAGRALYRRTSVQALQLRSNQLSLVRRRNLRVATGGAAFRTRVRTCAVMLTCSTVVDGVDSRPVMVLRAWVGRCAASRDSSLLSMHACTRARPAGRPYVVLSSDLGPFRSLYVRDQGRSRTIASFSTSTYVWHVSISPWSREERSVCVVTYFDMMI